MLRTELAADEGFINLVLLEGFVVILLLPIVAPTSKACERA